ncbi:hypothetical protein PFISCL1PPCAC_19912, partial [Pristionchus fissidentatus]
FDFDPVSAKSVSAHVAHFFDPSLISPGSRDSLNQSEKRWLDRIVMMLWGAEAGELSVREKVETIKAGIGEDSDVDWDFEEPEEGIKSQHHLWTDEMMDQAYAFYRSGQRKRNNQGEGCRSLAVMKHKFGWIKCGKDIEAITLYGKSGVKPTNRNAQLHKLAANLDTEVTRLIDAGLEFHDCNLQDRYRVTSRHITKIVSVKTNRDKEKTKKQVEDLQMKVEAIVAEHPDICIWNCDQSGLVKEAVGKRTLARKGEKKVEVICQSKSATTSSITLLPIIGSDGYLKPKQFIQLGEPKGELPQKGCFSDSTMEIAVGKSHIMGKETAKQFYKKVLFDGFTPPKLLLLLDSWPCFLNHAEIRSAAPPNCLLFILNIPPGGTSLCQPADLSFNHQLTGIQKRLKGVIMARQLDYKVSQRNKLLKFVAQLHFCMGADRFKPFIQYGFYKGGFIIDRPPRFVSPKEFIFGKGSMPPCSICSSRGCSICPRCEKTFCVHCFWVNLHRC